MPTVITSMHVRASRHEEFRDFQAKINDLVRRQPGFSGREVVCPVEGLQEDWVIIFRFDTNANLQKWLNLPERQQLLQEIEGALIKPASYQLVADESPDIHPATAVFSHKIQPGKDGVFLKWKRRITAARANYPGLIGSEMFEPVPGVQEDWIDIVQFDSPDHLNAWLNSPERAALLEEARQFMIEVKAKSVATGLENWFQLKDSRSTAQAPIPSWKQASLVLLALFPVTLSVQLILRFLPADTPWGARILMGNALGVAALTWIMMPRISRIMSFWCHPTTEKKTWLTHLKGGLIVYGTILLTLLIALWIFP